MMRNFFKKPKKFSELRENVEKALQVLLKNLPEDKHTEATKYFLSDACREHNALKSHEHNQEQGQAQNQVQELTLKIQALENEYKNLKAINDNSVQEIQKLSEALQHKEKVFQEKNQQNMLIKSELQQVQAEYTQYKANNLKDPEPAKLERKLLALAAPLRDIVSKYFDLDNVHIFLVQCGQFSRISQCWEACVRFMVNNEQPYAEMNDFLCLLGSLYNKGSAQAEAKILLVDENSPYNYEKQQRVGQDGKTVRLFLLPGLENAAGKIIHKPLVTLA